MERQTDGYKVAQMKLATDRALLERVGKLLATDQRGQGDLNTGEVLYARNVQIAFRTMLFFDGVAVARNLDIPANRAVSGAVRKAGGAAMRAVRAGAPYAMVLMAGPQVSTPIVMRLWLPAGRLRRLYTQPASARSQCKISEKRMIQATTAPIANILSFGRL